MDKYGLAIYNENRVKKRLSTYLDCGGLASVIFPTMKSLDAKKNDSKAEKATGSVAAEAPAVTANVSAASVQLDLSKVKIEPLFADDVDFETFSKSDFRVVKVKACEAVKKSKKLLQFTLDDGTGVDRTILSGIHEYDGQEGLNLLMLDNNIPAGAKLY